MEIQPEKIKTLARAKAPENKRFVRFLETAKKRLKKIDWIVEKIYAEVEPQIDCRACANCCKTLGHQMTEAEIKKIASYIGIDAGRFTHAYIKKTHNGTRGEFTAVPCPMLDGNDCRCYEVRSSMCKRYPHLEQWGFLNNLVTVFKNYEVCPIVFQVVERLKEETGYKP